MRGVGGGGEVLDLKLVLIFQVLNQLCILRFGHGPTEVRGEFELLIVGI